MTKDRPESTSAMVRVPGALLPEIVDVLTQWKALQGPARSRARAVLEKGLRVRGAPSGGARSPENLSPANLKRLLKFLAEVVRDERAHFDMAVCWLATKDQWRQSLEQWARSHGFVVWNPAHPEPGADGLTEAELTEAIASAPGLPADLLPEVRRLVLAMLLLKPLASDTPLPELYAGWLTALEQLPAGAPEWSQFDRFVSQARSVRRNAAQKELATKKALLEEQRRLLVEALARITAAQRESLERANFFHLRDRLTWEPAAFRDEILADVLALVRELVESLDKVGSYLPSPGIARGEFQRRQRQLQELEEQLTGICDRLDVLGGKNVAPSEPPNSQPDSGNVPAEEPVVSSPPEQTPQPQTDKLETTSGRSGHDSPTEQVDVVPAVDLQPATPVPPPAVDPLNANEETAAHEIKATVQEPPALEVRPEFIADSKSDEGHADQASSLDAAAKELVAHAEFTDESANALLGGFLQEGDHTAAYWIARALEAKGGKPEFGSQLLAGVAGAFLLPNEGAELLHAGLLEVVSTAPSELLDQPAARLLAVAAAIRATPDAPMAGMRGWLPQHEVPSRLRGLTEAIRGFADQGARLPSANGPWGDGGEQLAARQATAVRNAADWLRRAPTFTNQYGQASRLWAQLVRGPLTELLSAVVANDVSSVRALNEQLAKLSTDGGRRELIESAERELRVPQSIIGPSLRKLLRDIEDAYGMAAAWRDAVALGQSHLGNNNRFLRLAEKLREEAARELPTVTAFLVESANKSPAERTAARILQQSLDWLSWRLGIRKDLAVPSAYTLKARSVLDLERALSSVLAQRLKLVPELNLPEDSEAAWDNALSALPRLLAESWLTPRTFADIVEAWVKRGDFRFVPDLVAKVANPDERERLSARTAAEKLKLRDELKREAARLEVTTEQAFVESAIGSERADYLNDARTALSRLESSERLDISRSILERAFKRLDQARRTVVESLTLQWKELQVPLIDRRIDLSKVRARVDDALHRCDIRTADEMLAHLRQVAEGEDLQMDLFEETRGDKTLEAFLSALPIYERDIGASRGREVLTLLDSTNGVVPPGAKHDLKKALESWWKVEEARTSHTRVPAALADVLGFLGFEVKDAPSFVSTLKTAAVIKVGLSSRLASPVPDFGSRLEQRGGAEVVCVWPRKGANALHETLSSLQQSPLPRIVVYAGRLSVHDRQKLRLETRRLNLAVLVLDEWLLFFLERYGASERLAAFFALTLPWARLNPYVPRSVDVPPEMFFGRGEMARALGDQGPSYIVFGGRQLGKSALLEQVQLRFHDKQKGHFAIRMDIKAIGDPAALERGTGILFARLREQLKHVGFLPPNVSSDQPQQVVNNILKVLQDKQFRLLVLLDEADNFLDSDSIQGFQSVVQLRDAMLQANGRLKVVLAGLHSVQRFQGQPNQPFAQLGAALLVGPLEPDAALQLIRKPFEALGFRFNEAEGPLQHILSFTNYHPGLLQLFCYRLLEQLQTRPDNLTLPYVISEQDVEDVYRKRDVQHGIAERFQWTLALDQRYRALIYALILSQNERDVGQSKPLAVGEFLKEGQYWWKPAFERLRIEEVRGLLEEMVGLGVLARSGANRYRLRSPNVVRLLGSREDIERQLQELAEQVPPVAFLPDHHHDWLERSISREMKVSPFTYSQERQLRGDESGVMLVFGAEATGVNDVGQALRNMASHAQGEKVRTVYEEAPQGLQHSGQLVAWLKQRRKEATKAIERLVLHVPLPQELAARGEFVIACQDHLLRADGRAASRPDAPITRVVFSLSPQAAWRWISERGAQTAERDDVPTVSLRRWSREGVRDLLSRVEVPHDERAVDRLVGSAAGGWPILLREFLSRGPFRDGTGAALDVFERGLSGPNGGAALLWQKLGVAGIGPAVSVLAALREVNAPFDRPESLAGLLAPDVADEIGPLLSSVVLFLERLDLLDVVGGQRQLAPLLLSAVPKLGDVG